VPALEHVVQQCAISRTEQDFVVRNVGVASIGSEVEHEQRHALPIAREPAVRVGPARGRGNEVAVRANDVAVADDDIRGKDAAVR
jgi:hypothetical protein